MIVIAIAGVPGSGKTSISQKLQEYYGMLKCKVISLDDYYKDFCNLTFEERMSQNLYHPEAFDFVLLTDHLRKLKDGQKIRNPLYDLTTRTRIAQINVLEPPSEVLIVEGSFALHLTAPITLYNIKIYIDTDLYLCLSRCVRRDLLEHKDVVENVIKRYESTNRANYFEHIISTQNTANLVIHNNQSNFDPDFTEILDFISIQSQAKLLHRVKPNIISPTFNVLQKREASRLPGTLFVISGPSGVGKSSILREVLKRNIGIEKLIGYTTRPRRNDEIEGEDCHFISQEEFNSLLVSTPFLQHIEGLGNHYGIPAPEVLKKLEEGKSLIMDLTPEALSQVRQKVRNIKAIFICPPNMTSIFERLHSRNPTDVDITKRFNYSITMLEQAGYLNYDYFIINSNLTEASNLLEAIITSKHIKLKLQQKKNAILLNRFKVYTILMKVRDHVFKDLDIDACDLVPLSSLCNTSYKLTFNGKNYFLRILRPDNNRFRILQQHEYNNLQKANALYMYPPTLYYEIQTGFYISEFLSEHQLLTVERLSLPKILEKIIATIKRLHMSKLMENNCPLLNNLEPTLIKMNQLGIKFPVDMDRIAVICHRVADILEKTCLHKVPCNNDLNPYNILYREKDGNVIISDWECSGNNDPFWDMTKLSVECNFNDDQDKLLLRYYGSEINDFSLARFTLFKLLIEFTLAIWAKWQITIKNDAASDCQFERMFSLRLNNCRKYISSIAFDTNINLIKISPMFNQSCFLLRNIKLNGLCLPNSEIKFLSVSSLPSNVVTQNYRYSLFSTTQSSTVIRQSKIETIEQTLIILKPDILMKNKIGEVIVVIERTGLNIVAVKLKQLSLAEVEKLYPKMAAQNHRYDLLDLMTSGPVVLVVLEGRHAIAKLAQLKGNADPQVAHAGTLRKLFGTNVKWNAVHCSENFDEAKREILLFFKSEEIISNSQEEAFSSLLVSHDETVDKLIKRF